MWWDTKLYAGDDFHDVIREEIGKAGAVVVIWSEAAVSSIWVRGEAEEAFNQGKLISVHVEGFDKAKLPINFRTLHCECIVNIEGITGSVQRKNVKQIHFSVGEDNETWKAILDRASAGELEAWLAVEPEIAELVDRADAYGLYLIGNFFLKSVGPAHSATRAEKYYKLSAKRGCAAAHTALGRMYWEGDGVAKDDKMAQHYLRKAAESGDGNAQCLLGGLSLIGNGVEKDETRGVLLLRQSMAQGNLRAATVLGLSYEVGAGVPKDVGLALQFLNLAADGGEVGAQCRLGEIYERGLGVPKNRDKAWQWYERAAKQGNHAAMESIRRLSTKD